MSITRTAVAPPDGHLIGSPRLAWYNPKLDPHIAATKMTAKMRAAVMNGTYDDGTPRNSGDLETPDRDHPANLFSSLCADGAHRPALDIDLRFDSFSPAALAGVLEHRGPMMLIESCSGNTHAYVPEMVCDWAEYQRVMERLVWAGFLERRYVDHSLVRGQTLLRVPGVIKVY